MRYKEEKGPENYSNKVHIIRKNEIISRTYNILCNFSQIIKLVNTPANITVQRQNPLNPFNKEKDDPLFSDIHSKLCIILGAICLVAGVKNDKLASYVFKILF